MIPINQAELNTVVATCSRNKQLTGTVYYLWTMTHKLTKQNWKFIPYLLPATGAIGYEPSYDQFQIDVDSGSSEVFIATGTNDPVAYVKESSFGDIVWVRNNQGEYEGFIQKWDLGAILDSELTVMINNVMYDGIISAQYIPSNNSIYINTTQIGVGYVDDYLNYTTIEIRYYKP